jgi:hypothetical protein
MGILGNDNGGPRDDTLAYYFVILRRKTKYSLHGLITMSAEASINEQDSEKNGIWCVDRFFCQLKTVQANPKNIYSGSFCNTGGLLRCNAEPKQSIFQCLRSQ